MNFRRKIATNVNLFRSVFSYYRRKERVRSSPLTFWIEVTDKCNLACHYCSSTVNSERQCGNMSMETFTKIIGQIAPLSPGYITLHLAGEPLLNPYLCEMIALANENGIGTCFSTNAMLLDAEMRDSLINAGLGSIRIDFSVDREGFERERVGADWQRIRDNIVGLLTTLRDRRLSRPGVMLVNLSFPGRPSTSVDDLRKAFKDFPVFRFEEMKFHSWAGEYAKKVSQHDVAMVPDKACGQPYCPCRGPWVAMALTSDGKVVPCRRDLQAEMIVGDINEKDILDIWNDEPLRRLRRKLSRKEYVDVPLCRYCTALWEEPPFHRMVMAGLRRRLISKPFAAVRHLVRFGRRHE